MATEINAGRVAMVPKGEWSASTAYVRLDVVSYHGSSYVCKQDGTGQTPDTATNYWQLLSSGLDPTVDTISAKHYEGSTMTAETSISAAGVISKTASGVTKTFNLPAESGTLATTSQVAAKQDTLVSGTNIKTVNGTSVLGSGDIVIPAGPIGATGATGPQGPQGPKGDQGNSGYTGAAGELEVVNNLTDGGATAALSAEMGKTLNKTASLVASHSSTKFTDLKSTVVTSAGYISTTGSVEQANYYYHTEPILLHTGQSLIYRGYSSFQSVYYIFNIVSSTGTWIRGVKDIKSKRVSSSDYDRTNVSIFTATSECYVSVNVYIPNATDWDLASTYIGDLYDIWSKFEENDSSLSSLNTTTGTLSTKVSDLDFDTFGHKGNSFVISAGGTHSQNNDKVSVFVSAGSKVYFTLKESVTGGKSDFIMYGTTSGGTMINPSSKSWTSYLKASNTLERWAEFSQDVYALSFYGGTISQVDTTVTFDVINKEAIDMRLIDVEETVDNIDNIAVTHVYGEYFIFAPINIDDASFSFKGVSTFKELYVSDSEIVSVSNNIIRVTFTLSDNDVDVAFTLMSFRANYSDSTYSDWYYLGLKKNKVYEIADVKFVWDDAMIDKFEACRQFLIDNYTDVRAYCEEEDIVRGDSASGWYTDALVRITANKTFNAEAYDPYPINKPLITTFSAMSSVSAITPPSTVLANYSVSKPTAQTYTLVNTNGVVYTDGVLNVLNADTFVEIDDSHDISIDGKGHKVCFYDLMLSSTGISNSRRTFSFSHDCGSVETFVDQDFNEYHLSKTPFLNCEGRVCKKVDDALVPVNDMSSVFEGDAYYPLPKSFDTSGLDLSNAYLSYSVYFHRYTSKVKGTYEDDGITYIVVSTVGCTYPLDSEYSSHKRYPSIQIVNCYPTDNNCVYHNGDDTLTAPLRATTLYTRRTKSISGDVFLHDCVCLTPSVSNSRRAVEFVSPVPLISPQTSDNVIIDGCTFRLADRIVAGMGKMLVKNTEFSDSECNVLAQSVDASSESVTSYWTIDGCRFADTTHFVSNMSSVNVTQKYHISNCTFVDFGYLAVWMGYLVASTNTYSKSYGCVEHCRFYYTPEYIQRVSKIAIVPDGGVIYNATVNDLSVVRYNVIHSIYGKRANTGIYYDDGCSNCYCFNNYVFGIKSSAITMRYATTGRILPTGYSQNVNKYCGGNIVESGIVIGAASGTYSVCEGNVLVNGAAISENNGYEFQSVTNNKTCNGTLAEDNMVLECSVTAICYPESPFPMTTKSEQ